MSRAAKTGSGNDEDIILFCPLAESDIVFFQGLWEDVEGSIRFYNIEAKLTKAIVKKVAVGLVDGDIGGHVCTHGTDSMEKSGCIYIPQGTACACDCCVYQTMLFHLIRNKNVSQTLSGKREGFGPGVAYECVAVIFRQVWNYGTIEYDLAVRFVCNEVDRMSKFGRLFAQDLSKSGAGLM